MDKNQERRSLSFKLLHKRELGLPLFEKGEGDYSVQPSECNCKSRGMFSHTRGYSCKANADYSIAEGCESVVIGPESHSTEEWDDGVFAHAEGHIVTVAGRASHGEGNNTVTNNPSEHAEGQYNVSHVKQKTYGNAGNTQHSVGIGSELDRKNAFEIMQNGDVYVIGLGGYDGTNAGEEGIKPLQQLLSNL